MRMYRRTRQRVRELLGEVKSAGYPGVRIAGEGDIADICRLTCLEQGIPVMDAADGFPTLEVHGLRVQLRMEKSREL